MSHEQFCWVDLDATLAKYEQWKGLFTIGEPFPGARSFMSDLKFLGAKKNFKVGVFTTRTKLDMPGREVMEEMYPQAGEAHHIDALKGLVVQWLRMHKIPFDDVYTGQGKPPGIAYIDDRAVWCCPKTFGPEHAYVTAVEAVTNLLR